MGTMRYDSSIIVERAEDLRRQAVEVQIVGTLSSLAVGLGVGLVASLILSIVPATSVWREFLSGRILIGGFGLTFGLIGLLRAVEEARDLRFRAQLALLQVQVENHLGRIADLLGDETGRTAEEVDP